MAAHVLAFALGTPEIILIVVVLILFFGASRIPGIARGLGKSVSEFKKGKDEDPGSASEATKDSDKA